MNLDQATETMLRTPLKMIEQILKRHEAAVIEVAHELHEENKRLREGLKLITCEPINAEYMAQNILDGFPPYHDTMMTP